MHLITMAHLGEAQGVIDLFNLKRVTPQIYESEAITCLITGEGPFEAATATSALLGRKKFTKVMNLGIAGSLNPEFEIGQIYAIRSLYLVIEGKPQFKSFKSFESGIDCLTSFERILSPEKALPLSGMGQLVDREAWGVAMAAKNAGVEFKAFKLISDQAGSLGACELTRENAPEWSAKLAVYIKPHLGITISETQELELPGFYFTFTTQNQFKQILKKISIREEMSEEDVLLTLPLESLREEKILPKERARLLLSFMEEKLDPLKKKLQEGLSGWKNPFEKKGIQLVTDPTWESSQVKVTMTLENQEDLKQKLETLSKLNLRPFYELRDGNIHVE